MKDFVTKKETESFSPKFPVQHQSLPSPSFLRKNNNLSYCLVYWVISREMHCNDGEACNTLLKDIILESLLEGSFLFL